MKKTNRHIAALLCSFSLLVSGCSYTLPDIEKHKIEGSYQENAVVYRTLYASEVVSLNYLKSDSAVDCSISVNVIDGLIDFDEHGNIIPGLATSWESNEDLTTWTFNLRDDITWVDYKGEYYADVTADDWVCAYEYAQHDMANSVGVITVEADNNKTLRYTLAQPCPFFPSILSYSCYLPVCREYLDKTGSMFAKDYKHLLYNGAYTLLYFQPFEQQILVKNQSYWDKDHVYIDRIDSFFDYDAAEVSTEKYLKGIVDRAIVPSENLKKFLEDPEISEHIHRTKPDISESYFYAFNFNPRYDTKYEPDNWSIAVANSNFRKAIMGAIDKKSLMSIYEPYAPESLISNTLTPRGALHINGKEYTSLPALKTITEEESFNLTMTSYYRKIARKELRDAGVSFPIKILMPYDPSIEGMGREADKIALQIETALGRNFVDVIVEQGSSTGYDMSVIKSGKFALAKCSTSSDYYDPLTWIDPLLDGKNYVYWDKCSNEEVKKIHDKWNEMIDNATQITTDYEERYTAFSEAERYIIENAIIIPFSIKNGDGYEMCKLNEFEGEYAQYGYAAKRYKYHKLYDKSMNMDEYNAAYQNWIAGF